MKLYYSPGACSLSPHIVLHEIEAPHEAVRVDLKTKKTVEAGGDYLKVNPKGQVPALALEDGKVLTEGPAIVQYLADLKPEAGLAPANGSLARYELQGWLNYLSSEIHKSFSPLFAPATPEAYRETLREKLKAQFDFLNGELATREYVAGDSFSVADAYLFTLTNWARGAKLDLAPYPNVLAYRKRVGDRDAVKKAMKHEGLAK